jgi:hypothetical protein
MSLLREDSSETKQQLRRRAAEGQKAKYVLRVLLLYLSFTPRSCNGINQAAQWPFRKHVANFNACTICFDRLRSESGNAYEVSSF